MCRLLCMQEVESFLHRSGRTGRANRAGTAVAMYTQREVSAQDCKHPNGILLVVVTGSLSLRRGSQS